MTMTDTLNQGKAVFFSIASKVVMGVGGSGGVPRTKVAPMKLNKHDFPAIRSLDLCSVPPIQLKTKDFKTI